MSNTSSFFDPAAFLLAFNGREELLDHYLDSIPAVGITIQRPVTSVPNFVTHLLQCAPPERRILTSGLMEADGHVSHTGHERMLSALRAAEIPTEELRNLPAACLALWILINARDLFDTALSAGETGKSVTLAMFLPNAPVSLVADRNDAMNKFRGKMADLCGEKYGSDRILLRRFEDPDSVVIGLYFEKSPATRLHMAGSETTLQLAASEDRPIQFDTARFDPSTGLLIVHSSYGALTGQIRKAFADAFLNAPDAYEWAGASRILELSELIAQYEPRRDSNGRELLITEIEYSTPDGSLPTRYSISASDVLKICRRDGLLERIRRSCIGKLCMKMPLENSGRSLKVTLTAPNKVTFRGGPGVAFILDQLQALNVLQLQETARLAA